MRDGVSNAYAASSYQHRSLLLSFGQGCGELEVFLSLGLNARIDRLPIRCNSASERGFGCLLKTCATKRRASVNSTVLAFLCVLEKSPS